jgi:pantothenate kinase type III
MRTFQSFDDFLTAKQPLLQQGFEDCYLYLDGGNSALKWAIWQENKGRFACHSLNWEQPDPQLAEQLVQAIHRRYRFLIISSVRPDALERIQALLMETDECLDTEWVLALILGHSIPNALPSTAFPIANLYDDSQALGIDRLMVAYGVQAHILEEGFLHQDEGTRSVAVLDIGSAVTMDVLRMHRTSERITSYHGGVIAPGIDAIRWGMRHKTPRLPQADQVSMLELDRAPTSTKQALLWGQDFFWLKGMLGILKHYVELYAIDTVFLTGGGAQAFIHEAIAEAGYSCRVQPNLQFEGMRSLLSRLTGEL